MKKIVICLKDHHLSQTSGILLGEGIAKHSGYQVDIKHISKVYPRIEKADCFVLWGMSNTAIIDYQTKKQLPTLIMEHGYLGNRDTWVSLGYNGLNGQANFYNGSITDPTRFNKHFKLRDWNNSGDYVLVAGQLPFDMAIVPYNIDKWYNEIIEELNDKHIPVVFRQHPKIEKPWFNSKLHYMEDPNIRVEESLRNASACVTFSSNSGVLSFLNGVPTISYDNRSMVYNYTKHDLNDLSYKPDRSKWAAQIAYTQWLPEELESGEAWKHIKKGLD